MNTNPVFTRGHFNKSIVISTANTNLDGSGTIVDLVDCAAAAGKGDGCRIDGVILVAQANVASDTHVQFFIYNGSAWETCGAQVIAAGSVAAGTPIPSALWIPLGGYLTLPAGHKLGAAPYESKAFSCQPLGGFF